jgi:peptidyl-prolyl cis-trans isomerase B (cyclophilin B)
MTAPHRFSARMRALPLVAVLALAACGGSKHEGAAGTSTNANGCATVSPPKAAARRGTKPKAPLAAGKTYRVTIRTNCGSFAIRLDVKHSPRVAASFVALARAGYFDGTIFHRIVPGFIIQGGDPTASGLGTPGYKVVDKPPPSARYTHGVVAMAKAANEAPGTSGSQFFVVTAADAQLPPDYALLGTVVSGLPVVDRIGKLGDQATEQPTETVEIQKATVSVT